MLQSLFIKNYALIDELDIDFSKGLSILTGETGAGKSIILGAMSLILGKRADTSTLMDLNNKCIIETTFAIENYHLQELFKSLDIDYDHETVIRREISGSGKSRAFINDTPVNLNDLKELVHHLIDIHSQHETLAINASACQLNMIDHYAGIKRNVEDFGIHYEAFIHLKNELKRLREYNSRSQEEFDFYNHQLEELEQANLQAGEELELESELKTLSHMEEVKTYLQKSVYSLDESDQSINSSLEEVRIQLSNALRYVDDIKGIYERIQSVVIELKDVGNELDSIQQSLVFDPEKLQFVQDRLNFLHTLMHKHRVNSIEELISVKESLNQRLGDGLDNSLKIKKLEREHQEKEKVVHEKANDISNMRNACIPKFQEELTKILTQLGLKDAVFKVQLHRLDEMTETGFDAIAFLFSANDGVEVKEISKIASGGELSRLMLSLKATVARRLSLPTIVFDEIDTGISGEVADKTGSIIKELSKETQILCITHLPQMASKGNDHYLVYKDLSSSPPKTKIRKLSEEERVNEIAKMLSGEKLSEQAIANAKVLLNG